MNKLPEKKISDTKHTEVLGKLPEHQGAQMQFSGALAQLEMLSQQERIKES